MNKEICQFYVVVGDSSFIAPKDNNVYINATNLSDYKIIQDEIFKEYKEKAKSGINVGSEIIFLVGGISDSEKANDIISKLRLKGKIQVIGRTKKEEVVKNVILDKPQEEVKEPEPTPPPVRENFEILDKDVADKKEEIPKKEEDINLNLEENKQPDNVYRRDFESTNYNGYIGKPIEKKDKFGKLPLIIFIISLLLFICSIILLFVL